MAGRITPLRIGFLVLLIGTTLEVLATQGREMFRAARWRKHMEQHVVVIGYGTKGRSAIDTLVNNGVDKESIVVVDPSSKVIDAAVAELTQIAGQKPVVTRAKKSIASFKLREGQAIGAMVTLRQDRMWEFFDRLVSFALPRVRDFRGVSSRAFDGRGNYTLGIREQIVFPEIEYDKVDRIHGMNLSFVTTAKNDEQGRALLAELGMPFRK